MHRGSPEVEKIFRKNKAGTTIISKYDYTVNAIGQRTEANTSGTAFPATPSWSWGYDSLGQVISADSSVNTNDRAYQYDAIGNRKKSANSLTLPGSDNYTSNALNQYSSIGNPQSTIVNPLHDFDGNLTSGQLPTGSAGLVWDSENRLVSTTVNSVITTYLYDAQSRRIARTTAGSTTVFVYDGWNCIAEYSGTTLSKARLWGLDLSGTLQGAGGVGGLLAEKQGSDYFFPTYDGNGNVSEYLAADGSTAAHFEYDPFGNTVVNTDTSNQFAYRFSTKPLDQVTGLYYYGYRYYDPATGRWSSRDPIGERGGINLYGFVGNNGVNGWDLLGMEEKCCPDVESFFNSVFVAVSAALQLFGEEGLPENPADWGSLFKDVGQLLTVARLRSACHECMGKAMCQFPDANQDKLLQVCDVICRLQADLAGGGKK